MERIVRVKGLQRMKMRRRTEKKGNASQEKRRRRQQRNLGVWYIERKQERS
jgi:hypothetical protein